ncbi:hypothetical protein vseg_003797 [Gypsophila vaccaria]
MSEDGKKEKERRRLEVVNDFHYEDEVEPPPATGQPTVLVGNPSRCLTTRLMVDASWKGEQQAGIGWTLWTQNEGTLEHGQRCVADSPLMAEALGLREAIIWAKEKNYLHLSVFSDCLQLVIQVTQAGNNHHCIWRVLRDIHFLTSYFHCFTISYVPRSLNTRAHQLAKNAMRA